MSFSFIHAADLHLDSPLRGLEAREGAPVERLRQATRQALVRLVDLALQRRVAFVVIAGDVYDGDWKDAHTGRFFFAQMARLTRGGIRVFLIHGNHDAASIVSQQLTLPEGVTVFSSRKAETVHWPELELAVHGRSFPRREVPENWVPEYPEAVAGCFNLGLLHTSADGRPGHHTYAPCQVSELAGKGYQYWALGHVHEYALLHQHPHVVFSGCVQGRHINETGPKGCVVVTVTDRQVSDLQFEPLSVVRWESATIDLSEVAAREPALALIRTALAGQLARTSEDLLALRLTLTGRCPLHQQLFANADRLAEFQTDIHNLAEEELGSGRIWLERLSVATEAPVDLAALSAQEDSLGRLLRYLQEPLTPAARAELLASMQDFIAFCPDAAKLPDLAGDEATWAQLQREMVTLLLPRLRSEGR